MEWVCVRYGERLLLGSFDRIKENAGVRSIIMVHEIHKGITDGKIHHHCYQEGGSCAVKNIECNDNKDVIVIVWSRVGYSQYWESNNERTNCSVTDDNCEMGVDQLTKNCSGLRVCGIKTCNENMRKYLNCSNSRTLVANYMRIKYKCIARQKFESSSTPPISSENTLDPNDTSRQSRSDNKNTLDPNDTSRQSRSDNRKTTIIVISVMTVIIIIIVIVVVSIIIIRRRRKKKEQSQPGDDPKEANNSPVLNKQESGVNVIDSANYVTSGKVTEDTFDLETRCVGHPSLETSVVDNLNYASFGQREDIDQIDLPTSKADLNTDTELVDNDDYVGFGEK
ncbi:hypothetical protein LSH36_2039g00015 [Paralvinella palmiformis]|uniref:Uncharacterized protein n=1 Tax=Paralvinella palmiformis TaxID=53620 RepID=A0AAD9MPM7_9ANNE|nr:hypothetical protein LSH36_2039g00015 [Paralvinella palmiformis]